MSSSSVFFPRLLSRLKYPCFPSSNSPSSVFPPLASHILPGSQINLRCLWKIIIIDRSAVARQPYRAGTRAPIYRKRRKNSKIAKKKTGKKIDSKYINILDKNRQFILTKPKGKTRQRCALSVCVNQQFSDIKDRGKKHGCGLE